MGRDLRRRSAVVLLCEELQPPPRTYDASPAAFDAECFAKSVGLPPGVNRVVDLFLLSAYHVFCFPALRCAGHQRQCSKGGGRQGRHCLDQLHHAVSSSTAAQQQL
jgi:hypothetical protein